MTDIKNLIEEIDSLDNIDYNKSFELVKICSKLLRKPDADINARRIIIHILNKWNFISEESKEMWIDLIEASGFYPYLHKNNLSPSSTIAKLRYQIHKSENISRVYFHEEQKILIDLLNTDKNVIVSAPTSFGKSLLIEDIVASKKFKNIVIIQPTLALLDETRKKLKVYSEEYKIIIRTSQRPSSEKGNLFLLTAERVMEYQDLPKVDLLILDEFYKLSEKRDDERSDVLNNAFHMLLKRDNVRFYLLGPNIKNISAGFAEKYNAIFKRTDYSLVDQKIHDLSSESFGPRGEKKEAKEKALFELLIKLKNDQSIIYCSSPYRARYLSNKFRKYLQKNNIEDDSQITLIDWIKENVNENWGLIKCLKNKIGFHDGALQRHITTSIIKYFNEGQLNFLFCTSTIIEGVNTSAKNVIYFDEKKGGSIIDYFDYSNIKGRAGRLMIHYIGEIYVFNQIPEKNDLIVDIPFFEQNPIADEVLIHLDKEEIKNQDSEQYKELEKLTQEERELFRRNGLSIKGQKKIVDFLEANLDNRITIGGRNYSFLELIQWKTPNYHQLQFILDICWDYLRKARESLSINSANQLTQRVMTYTIHKKIKILLQETYENYKDARDLQTENWHKRYKEKSDEDLFEDAARDTFQVLKHWFNYKVPKWLRVFSELQKYVCNKRNIEYGDYSIYANQLENDFVRSNLSILVEFGIPKTAIDKIKKKIPSNISEDEVVDFIKNEKVYDNKDLSEYEKEKITDSL